MIRRSQKSRGRNEEDRPLELVEEHPENMATATAMAEQEPDLEVGEQSRLLRSRDDEPLGEVKGSIKEKAVAGISAVSFAASVLSMLVESNPIVYISGTIGAAISPYAAIQQQKITEVEALAETNDRGTWIRSNELYQAI